MIPALAGVRVLDLTELAPGPYCTMLLADFGADVLVVERVPPPEADRTELADRARSFALGRNKRSVCVDLKQTEGASLFRDLARRADVVIEGFRPGVVDRLGIGPKLLCGDNDRLVYCSLSGYGQTGPYRERAGHDLNYVAIGGALGMIGRPGGPPAIPMNLVADYAGGGLLAAFAIVLALFSRERTGCGQVIDVAMTDGVLSLLTKLAGQCFDLGVVPEPGTHRINGGAPYYDVYPCRGGGHLAIGALEPRFFAKLCEALELPDLASRQHDPTIRQVLAERIAEKTRDEWTELLGAADACATPVLALDEALRDPHHIAREMIGVLAGRPTIGVAPKLEATPGTLRTPPPAPGEHTDEILAELGLDPERIGELRKKRVVG